jgi:hypothetical protein
MKGLPFGRSRRLAGIAAAMVLIGAMMLAGCVAGEPSGYTVRAEPMIWEGPTTFEDPEGRYSLYVPAGWSATREDGYGCIVESRGRGEAYALVGEGPDIQAIVAEGLRDVGFPLTVTRVDPVPDMPTVAITYDTGDPARFAQALCTRSRGKVYVLLLRARQDALEELDDAFQEILNSYAIAKEGPAAVSNTASGRP